jgi:hypothetical protein
MHMRRLVFLLIAGCGLVPAVFTPAGAQVSVWTYHNDNHRTGLNTNETLLNLTNVNPTSFGGLFTNAVDGCVYAQPLYVPGVVVPGSGRHNVLFIATEHNTVYAFDAETPAAAGGLLWKTNLGPAAVTTIPGTFTNRNFGTRYNNNAYTDIIPEVGITSTPVIDPVSGTLYVDAFTGELGGGVTNYFHRLHALNITNGTERPNSPVLVSASVPGVGVGSTSGRSIFNAQQQLQRCALTLANGIVYLAFAGYADTDPYHGWIIGFSTTNLAQLTNYVFNTTPNSSVAAYGVNAGEGGLWMSGGGLAVDDNNNLFFEVGNGIFNVTNNSGRTEYGDSFMKLSTTNGLAVADYFTPWNQFTLQANDTDLGSGGLLLLPDQPGAFPHLLLGAGKQGQIYLINRDQMTTGNNHFDSTNVFDFVVQTNLGKISGSYDTPAFFSGRFYYAGNGDNLKSIPLTNGLMSGINVLTNKNRIYNFPGATPSISASGTNNGIVWAIQMPSTNGNPGVLVACNAMNFTTELYTSTNNASRDQLGSGVKFAVPAVADGKVFVGCSNSVFVFGLFAGSVAFSAPAYTVLKNGGTATITVTRMDGTNGAISVAYATVPGGTAASGANYLDASGTLNWTNGESASKSFTVSILDNNQPSTNLTVNLALSAPAGGAGLGGQSTATLTILPPPTTVTLAASGITTNGATLNGSVYPNGAATKAWFLWGTTTNLGNVTSTTNLGSGTGAVAVSNTLSGLLPGTLYYYLVTATNTYGAATTTGTNFVTLDVPRSISGLIQTAPGQFAIQFAGSSNVGYTVLETTNVSLPASNWTVLGPATLLSNNLFQFSDTQATNVPLRFYRLRSP